MTSESQAALDRPLKKRMASGARPKVAICSQPEYFRFMYENELSDLADTLEFKLQIGLPSEAYKPLIEFQADYNIFFRGEYVPDPVLSALRGHRIALSSEPFPRIVNGRREFTKDSLMRYLFFRSIRSKSFDYLFHYDAASLPFLAWDGLHVSGAFPFPVATSVFRPLEREKRWELFFIGRSTAHRERYFGLLKHFHNFLHICHGVWGPPLVEYLCSAKICLNVHVEDEISWEPRMQMMLACGAFVISEKITPNDILCPGTHYVEVNGPHELYTAVKHYLKDDAERERIAANGRQRVLECLESQKSFRSLMDGIADDSTHRFEASRGSALLNRIARGRRAWTQFKSILRETRASRPALF